MRRKNKGVRIFAICLGMLFIVSIGFGGYMYMQNKELSEINAMQQSEIESNQQTVYVVSTEDGNGLSRGTVLEEDVNVVKQQIVTGLDSDSYITEEDLGKELIVDVKEGEPIGKNMITDIDISQDTRKYELAVVNLMTTQKPQEYVDVRIMFPTGEDYLVLAKKQVQDLNLENCVFTTYMSEEEIVRMASATIDAFTITGTKLYTTKVVEPSLQNPLIPNYPVKAENIDLLNSDPNILEVAQSTLNLQARINLESRLKVMSPEQLAAVSDGHGLEDTAQSSVLTTNQQIAEDMIETDENGEPILPEEAQEAEDGQEEASETESEIDEADDSQGTTLSSLGNAD